MNTAYNPLLIENVLRDVPAQPPYPRAADRTAWQQARARLGQARAEQLIQQAEAAAASPIPPLTAALWLECLRTGRRESYEDPCYLRRTRLRDLVLGECLEYQGRFLDPIMDMIWAICEESSWVYPAHHTALPSLAQPYIDLGAAETAYDLAIVASLLGRELPPQVAQRIGFEVDQRVLSPYLARNDFWWLYNQPDRPVNNWTAVCNAGVMAAALALESDPARLAAVLAKGIRSLEDYRSTFDEDGGTAEGPGYWSYGFGYYTLIAQALEQRTAGKITLMDGEFIRKIAAFPVRTMLSPGAYVTFSDAPRRAAFISPMLTYLGHRLNLPALLALAADPVSNQPSGLNADFCWQMAALFWDLDEPELPDTDKGGITLALHDWYNGMMWMIARCDPGDPDALVLAAKGGHNDEMHNHNDLGSFIVQVNQETLINDPGCGHYTLDYFGNARYSLFVPSSTGHPVPVPNGQVQQAGRQFAAQLLEHSAGTDSDVLALDLRAAYPPQADLEVLERRFTLHRAPDAVRGGWLELEDRFAFRHAAGSFENALTTFARVTLEPQSVLLTGERGSLRIDYTQEMTGVRLETYSDVAFADGPLTVYRIVFFCREPQQQGSLHLRMEPV